MVSIIRDRVCELSTTTGTGDLTLTGALDGFQSFADVSVSTGDRVPYLIEAVDADGVPTGEWETGIGSQDVSPTIFERVTVHDSSDGGAPVSFSAGTKRVYLAATANLISYRGSLFKKAANHTAQDFTSATAVTWDTTMFDAEGLGIVSSTKIAIPTDWATYNLVRLTAQIGIANITADQWVQISIKKNGVDLFYNGIGTFETGSTTPVYQVQTPVLIADNNDFFEVFLQVESDNSIDIVAIQSFFQIEVLQ